MWATVWHHVRDYDRWRIAFDRHRDVRQRYGCKDEYVYRGVQDPNDLVIALQFPDHAAASAFFADAGLRDVMRDAGVDSEPTFSFSEPARVPA